MPPHMTAPLQTRNIKTVFAATLTTGALMATTLMVGTVMVTPHEAKAAGDYSSSSSSESALLKAAKSSIKSQNYQDAYDQLTAGIGGDPKNADLHNLLGFSARKIGLYAESEQHYTKALSIDPKHKQALEYMGELYLTLGQIDDAEKLRARLDDVCWLGCDELDDLDQAIQDWKAKNPS